jgi:uncharacterized protein YegL
MRYRVLGVFIGMWLAAGTAFAGLNIAIILDDSGSMTARMRTGARQTRIELAKAALLKVLEQVPPDAKVGLLALNTGGSDRWVIPLGHLERSNLQAALARIEASGGTPLGAALKSAADELLRLRGQDRYGTYKLLVVTDGEATDAKLLDRHLPDILARGLVVDVIGVDMASTHSLATRVHTYRRADDPASLATAIEELVLGESVGGPVAAGESDFELLAELQDDLAVAALRALAEPHNAPIGARPAEEGKPAPRKQPTPATSGSGQKDDGGGSLFAWVIGIVMVIIVVSKSSALIRGSKRRR